MVPTVYREPLCPIGVLPLRGWSYPSLFAHTGSCASPFSLLYSSPSVNGSLQVVVSPCWEKDLPDVIAANLSLRAWTPTPAALVVHSPVSSHKTSAFPTLGPGRRLATLRTATSVRARFSRLQSFRYVQARRFARHPGRPYRSSASACRFFGLLVFSPFPGECLTLPNLGPLVGLGSRGFSFRAPHSLLPPCVPDMLAVRIEQLTAGDFHPIRSAALSAAASVRPLCGISLLYL